MWTKSQKISASVLALAVVAFGVDRFVLDGGGATPAPEPAEQLLVSNPSSAAPAAPQAAPAPATPTVVTNAAQPPGFAKGVSLASRLNAMAEARRFQADTAADAFRPSDQWLADAAPPSAKPKPNATISVTKKAAAPLAPKIDHAANFMQTHTLTGVMKDKDGGMAIVNGKLYRPGQYVDGFKLTKVGLKDARFWGKGTGATLKLAGQQASFADAR
jgi:hypothetical protein